MLYKTFIRPFLFLFDPEVIHKVVLFLFRLPLVKTVLSLLYNYKSGKLHKKIFGIEFPNPVGLAAGFDKDAEYIDAFSAMGFGYVEIGTVTPLAQPGNPKPRLFRLKKDQAIVNRMGFNNQGVAKAVQNIKQTKRSVIVGGNIGKNKLTPNENALDDYLKCFNELFDYVHYFVVNVSSPNTPGLRDLQEKEPLLHILNSLQKENNKMPVRKPVLLKIAPDLSNEQLDDIIDIVKQTKIDGLVATNTTISRDNLLTDKNRVATIGSGGLSGRPLFDRSNEVIRYIKAKLDIPVIGVGGIMSVSDAQEKIKAGADLLQIYTGFIYKGPNLIKEINKNLATH
jgi:dihydroorotate dehydrogenase